MLKQKINAIYYIPVDFYKSLNNTKSSFKNYSCSNKTPIRFGILSKNAFRNGSSQLINMLRKIKFDLSTSAIITIEIINNYLLTLLLTP